ncbi:rho GTPase-activating protein 7 isoform X1 [Lactuca sativa]|uniref:rho GTPase-activating protein 7 isoform X1 n=1 Tax=Lactuca sativa TaxID=4236 RepID=UPI000CD97B87|nr:rho GTPase-activating protein 7 isoform X1 [Lactuca sativa]
MSASLAAFERPRIGATNTVFKSGPLFISSKGLGWKSWKKRWFILTRTSLVFFKNDPSAIPQRGGEVNLTLGGIDLNNSGSVVVREDKKLLTVLFPDGRDGRAFTLKAETSEDLFEWKTALEHALAQAPSAALVMGNNGIFRNDTTDSIEGPFHQWRDKRPIKSLVVGRPILLALEDIDGGPSFLEKALRFLEKHGTKVEGILRQAADVEEVDKRVQEYETGKTEFGSDEDAHVVGDCVKHVLRELPSSPVPASCCTALLEAHNQGIDRKEARVNAMRAAILETFPEPNRRLLQRILKMMHTVSLHTFENRMTPSAVAACMAPLLLRPLLAGECELEDDDFDNNNNNNNNNNGDNSAQLLAAANAANNAQAIITTLLEEYDNIFDDDTMLKCSMSADSRMDNSASEDSMDDENMESKSNGYHDAENEADQETDAERVLSGKLSESSGYACSDLYDFKVYGADESDVVSPRSNVNVKPPPNSNLLDSERVEGCNKKHNEMETPGMLSRSESHRSVGTMLSAIDQGVSQPFVGPKSCNETPISKFSGSNSNSNSNAKRSTFWGRNNNGRKTPSMESVDSSGEEELAIQRLELTKNDLRQRIAKEARGNAILQASLERRKQALHERRLALEQDVSRLQEQLQAERDLRAALEVGLSMSSGQVSGSRPMDSKTRAELEEIALAEADVARLKQKVAELHHQLNQQRQHHYGSLSDNSHQFQHPHNHNHNHNPPQRFFQQDFDTTLAYINHERKQRTEENSLEMRNIKGQQLTSGNSNNGNNRQPSRKQLIDSTSLSDSKSTEASTSLSVDDFGAVDSATMIPSSSRPPEVVEYPRHQSAASSTLVELTTRLDFFKERRSQLMEQLHNLDLNYGTSSQDFMYKQSSPR